ncbi:MAG: putative peptidoglycan glycosyltransferase FtsW [Patescibacteria group bacterium]|nr:putative peptidoglycan glycosyltransferase FtsW [Patescibacteria group bacterium]
MAARVKINRWFLFNTLALALVGFLLFISASLGLLNRGGARFNVVATKQLIILLASLFFFFVAAKINYRFWRKASFWVFLGGLAFTLLVFVPGLGFESGGARRWIDIGALTIQPSEFLKLAFILYLANWLTQVRSAGRSWQHGLVPLLVLLAIVSAVIIAEPDIDTLVIIFASGFAMFFAAGAKWRHLLLLLLIVAAIIGTTALFKPYIRARVSSFINPQENTLSSSYQINQSLIALGSGGVFGRGFGQSIQKFKYLPEPIGDSIFSVVGEEFGLLGTSVLLLLFLGFGLFGLKISATAPTPYGRLIAVGIVIMLSAGAFINVTSMTGLIPLTGTPLIFVSHGGTALLVALISAGIVLNVSRRTR